jgi:pimeloyl-ACP methyl ester carboxylesterase
MDTAFSLDAAAGQVGRALEGLAPGRRAVLVGLSLGGYVAVDVASRWPERVAGLVLAGTSLDPVGARSLPFRGLAWLLATIPAGWLGRYQTWWFRRRYPRSVADPIIERGWYFRGGADALRSLVGVDFRARLAQYPGRVLIVNGQTDLLYRAGAKRYADATANARRVVLRGAGHRSSLDRPRAFSALVREFAEAL